MKLDVTGIVLVDIPEEDATEFFDDLESVLKMFVRQRDPNATVSLKQWERR